MPAPRTPLVLAATAGIAVANLYYIQPLLEMIARDLHAGVAEAGWISLGMQLGYALGILLFVPLGDIVERRTLAIVLLACAAVGLAAMALAPGVLLLALAALFAGATTIVAQVVIPFAADLADAASRGRMIATVQTGLVVGTVYSRAAGGVLGAHFGWRAVFWYAAAITAAAAVAVARALPLRAPHADMRYPQLLRSLATLTRAHPSLRASMALGFCVFATYSACWTTVAFQMKALGYGSDVVGTLGITALVGAFVAIPFGGLADRRGTLVTSAFAVAALAATFVLFLLGAHSVIAIFAGMLCFPIGMQLNQISNQARIFALDAGARSRLNTVYMAATFSGGAAGALAGAAAWSWGGWIAVCAASLAAIGCAAIMVALLRVRAGGVPSPQTSDAPAGGG